MASNKQVLDIQPSKGAYPMAVGDEQSRNWTERQWDYQLQKEGATYDRTRTHLNFEIAPGAKIVSMGTNKKIGDRFKERCQELGLGDPNFKIDKATGKLIPTNRVTTAWIQLGGSREQMHKLAFGDQKVNLEDGADNSHIVRMKDIEKWALAQYRWACKLWGEENIIGFNVHLDELNPHCHCTVIPVATIKGKQNISFNTVFYTPKTMKERLSAIHDELAVVNKPFGLERGDKVSETGAKHRTKDEYLRDKAHMEKAVKGLTTMVSHLTEERNSILAEIESLKNNRIADGTVTQSRFLNCRKSFWMYRLVWSISSRCLPRSKHSLTAWKDAFRQHKPKHNRLSRLSTLPSMKCHLRVCWQQRSSLTNFTIPCSTFGTTPEPPFQRMTTWTRVSLVRHCLPQPKFSNVDSCSSLVLSTMLPPLPRVMAVVAVRSQIFPGVTVTRRMPLTCVAACSAPRR